MRGGSAGLAPLPAATAACDFGNRLMKLQLPPGISAPAFERAMAAFRRVVGDEWVLDSDADRHTYSDPYAPGPEDEWAPAAAVAPASTEEVQAIVRLANEHRIPLWPVSRGKNLGYGGAAPRLPGSVVVDLGRMNRILEVDEQLGYCVIEPGVSFYDLQAYLDDNKIKLWQSVPGNGWGSVVGNALDRGFGYTPYGDHTANICGMEVVLPDGDLIRTGMGAIEGSRSWHVHKYGYGPAWDQLFVQSSYGIVTRVGMWMMPAPESSLLLAMNPPKGEDIGWLVETISQLRLRGVIDQSPFLPCSFGKLSLIAQRADLHDGPGPVPEEKLAEFYEKEKLGFWIVGLRLYGDESVTRARAELIKKAFARHTDMPFHEIPWTAGDPRPIYDPSLAVPTAMPLQMSNWAGGRGGHLSFSPVLPATSKDVLPQFHRSRERYREFGFEYYGSFTVSGRTATNINMIMYNRDDADEVRRARALFDVLTEDAHKAGYGEYRAHLGWMDKVADTFDFNNHALRRLGEKVKDALDPNGILAPGKQGIWPSTYRSHRHG